MLGFFALELRAHQYVMLDYNLTLKERSLDTVFLEVFDDKPLTQANFMQYVNAGKYNGTIMHRLARNFVIQGGGFYPQFVQEPAPVNVSLNPNAVVDLDGNSSTPNPTVNNEYSVGTTRSNIMGTVAMARVGGQPNSATNQWFVNLNNNTGLDNVDGGFTVFARVIGDGMTLLNTYNSLSIANLNPDVNDDGVRDGGPFFNYQAPNDGVPYLGGSQQDILVLIEKAKRIDYLGGGMSTSVPSGGLPFNARDAFIDTGTVFTGSAANALIVSAGRTMGIRENYSLNRGLINLGTLAPGLQIGAITLQSFRQDPGAKLEIQLRLTEPDIADIDEYDRVLVTGGALLGGDLNVSLLNNFVPVAGQSFTVLTAGAIVGDFNNINLPQLTPGLVWDISKTATAYTLWVVSADYDRNGVVDAADYVIWRHTLGGSTSYERWKSNLGNMSGGTVPGGNGSGGGSGSAVPEPAAALLFITGMFFLAISRRRFRENR